MSEPLYAVVAGTYEGGYRQDGERTARTPEAPRA